MQKFWQRLIKAHPKKSAIDALMLENEPSQNIELPFCKTTCLFSGLIWEKESETGTC